MFNRLVFVLGIFLSSSFSVFAVEPDEVLSDPVLEERAREISKGIRCLVCQNESIDESNADLAKDLRIVVRERLVAGDTNDEVVEFIVERYGQYALLKPQAKGANLILYYSVPLVLIIALLFAGKFVLTARNKSSHLRSKANSEFTNEDLKKIEELIK